MTNRMLILATGISLAAGSCTLWQHFQPFPEQPLPAGWTLDRKVVAAWGTALPRVVALSPDSLGRVDYWTDYYTNTRGQRFPIPRARFIFGHTAPLFSETVELQFVNLEFIYTPEKHGDQHFVLETVTRNIELQLTGFPQLTAQDVIRHKILMVYGTPQSMQGNSYVYRDADTEMAVTESAELKLVIKLRSLRVAEKLERAIQERYTEEGINLQKQKSLEKLKL